MHGIVRHFDKLRAAHAAVTGRLERHKEAVGEIVEEAVRTGEAVAGGAAAAAVDYYMGDKKDAIPEAMVGPVPVNAAAALVLKGAAFAFTKSGFSMHLHEFSNGLGAGATALGLMRMLKAQAG